MDVVSRQTAAEPSLRCLLDRINRVRIPLGAERPLLGGSDRSARCASMVVNTETVTPFWTQMIHTPREGIHRPIQTKESDQMIAQISETLSTEPL